MYLVPVEVRESNIEGKGVFAMQGIKKDVVVWKYDSNHDKSMSLEDFEHLTPADKEILEKVGYISTESNRWIYPPENDPARFTNHSKSNNLSAVLDKEVSDEPIFVANRDIKVGEELTNNYLEFDTRTITDKPAWT